MGNNDSNFKKPRLDIFTCDYCKESAVCKVTVHNHFWHLCLKHAYENRERLHIKIEDLKKLEAEINAK